MKQILKKSLKSFLDGSVNIFEDKDVLDHLYDEVPVVILEIISKIIKYESQSFCLNIKDWMAISVFNLVFCHIET